MLSACTTKVEKESDRILIFLHNRFLEEHALSEEHPEFGRVAYAETLAGFQESGLTVLSEKRSGNVNARAYAVGVVAQVDSLINSGVAASNITVVGTSKGGYIAQYVSTLASNPELNFVFIACYQDANLIDIPEINYCGSILNLYEKSDPCGVSALARKNASSCEITHFKELELNTGLGHGFLFKPLKEWMEPTIKWAKGDYSD